MEIKNQIISYFVCQSEDKSVNVFLSPVTMNHEVARKIIKEEYGNNYVNILQVCYDKDSRIIYVPNAHIFTKEQVHCMLPAAKYYILKHFGDYKMAPPIESSPFSSLRVRSIESFGYVSDAIKKHFDGELENLTVIEANLSRMPTTVKSLPTIYKNNKNYSGGLIDKSVANEITFYDEITLKGKSRKEKIRVMTVETPFILIDISHEVNPTHTEKEWAVLSGYRDYISSNVAEDKEKSDIIGFAPLYASKRYLYMGWPFEEVCKVMLECVESFPSLMWGIYRLVLSASDLMEEGYKNPAKHPYYMSFKIDPTTFPLKINSKSSASFFSVEYYDKDTGYVIIRSLAYVDTNLCFKILKAQSRPYIVHYNPTLGTIDVKVQDGIHKELIRKTDIPSKIKNIIEDEENNKNLKFRSDKRSRSTSMSSNEMCHIRKISEYYYAKDYIEKMCEKRGEKFEDIQVMVGPIERIFGRGVQGGFMGKKEFEKNKLKIPYQIDKGLFVSPPIISVNSETMPSYAEQTETLIHEYSHKIYSITNPEHEHLYNKSPALRNKNPKKYWDLYLNDEDERLAHKEEIMFELKSGKSVDEIVRNKVGGAITKNSYKKTYMIALKFKEIVEEVAQEMEKM